MTTGVHNCEGRHSDPRDVTRESEILIRDRYHLLHRAFHLLTP